VVLVAGVRNRCPCSGVWLLVVACLSYMSHCLKILTNELTKVHNRIDARKQRLYLAKSHAFICRNN